MIFLGSEELPAVPLHELVQALPIGQQYELEGRAQRALHEAGVDGAESPYVRAIDNPLLDHLAAVVTGREQLRREFDQMTRVNEMSATAAADVSGVGSLMFAAALINAETEV